MDYMKSIAHLKSGYGDQFSSDSFEDGAIELMQNDLYHGLKHLMHTNDLPKLSGELHSIIHKHIAPKLEHFVMSYASDAYIIGVEEHE